MKSKKEIKKRLEFWETWLDADIQHKDWPKVCEDEACIKILKWVLEDVQELEDENSGVKI